MVVVGHFSAPWLPQEYPLLDLRSTSPTGAGPILGCHSATYFDVAHIQVWLFSKGTP